MSQYDCTFTEVIVVKLSPGQSELLVQIVAFFFFDMTFL